MMFEVIAAAAALDALPIGSRIVACDIDESKTARGVLFEHFTDDNGLRLWRDLTNQAESRSAGHIVRNYDDMVIVALAPDSDVPPRSKFTCACQVPGSKRCGRPPETDDSGSGHE